MMATLKWDWIAAVFIFIAPQFAVAGSTEEMCSVLNTVNGRAVWGMEACAKHETPMPCTKITTNKNGSTLYQDTPCAPGKQKTIEQVQREDEAAQKAKCGNDFGKIRIGMTLDRYEECTDGLTFVTDTVSKNSVMETYRSTFYYIHAKDGRIVAFTRR